MHPSALNYGRLFFETYRANLPVRAKVVDIGSQNVNGSIRDVCPDGYEYIGVDFVAGNGVDIILDDPCLLPFENESIDVVVCSSCFEHSEMFWLVFNEILRVLKPVGLLYVNAPSNGYIHRYPVDCWRFYPDAGHALVTWAKRNGYNPVLLESFVGPKSSEAAEGAWNDFISIFAKDQALEQQFKRKIIDSLEHFDNGQIPGSNELINFNAAPEDFRLIEQLRLDRNTLAAQKLDLEVQVEDASQQIVRLESLNKSSAEEVNSIRKELQSLRLQLMQAVEHNNERSAQLETTIRSIHQSTSWKVTAPLRLASRAIRGEHPLVAGGLRARALSKVKSLYWTIPPKYRTKILHWGYRNLDIVFRGSAHYEQWKHGSQHHASIAHNSDNTLIMMDTVSPIGQFEGRIAIHLHMYYHDLAVEFAGYLSNMPFVYDLYVSVKDSEGEKVCRTLFTNLEHCNAITVEIVQNRGRDIAPMFCAFGESLKTYDYVAHLHSKKSLYNAGATEGWRQYLLSNLLGSPTTIRKIFNLLWNGRGIVYPQNYKRLPYQANTWLANKAMGAAWCARLGITPVPRGYFDFPAGSMFWARGDALQPLFGAHITLGDFAEETGQTDGTFAHCLERLLVLSVKKQGLQPAIIKDLESPAWSPWRLDQYTNRSFASMVEQFSNPNIKYIAFDIFDTLVVRPLIDTESIKAIVSANLSTPLAQLYSSYRSIAEAEARQQKGKDVGLEEIYARFQQLTRLPAEDVSNIRTVEERTEYESLSARSGGVELFNKARATGKPVILMSDMFLPKSLIVKALRTHGIDGWSEFFLSNEVGLRKDSGQLYDHLLKTYDLRPNELLMVGDNERSDFQIPCDKGIVGLHVLRATELARSLPRLHTFVETYEFAHDLNAELTLGLLFSKNFSAVSYPNINPSSLFDATPYNLGYSLVGPMLTSMAQWLVDTAANDDVERLYFLAREGQLMKSVYDVWAKDLTDVPVADYLVVSRRTCSVPLLKQIEDIHRIAKSDYHLNTAANFLIERFGLELSDAEWEEVFKDTGIGRTTFIEVHHGHLDAVQPLLLKIADDILTQAATEHQALALYLKSMNLMSDQKSAVVDIGYGGTIQGYLCQLTGKKIDGYYLVTDVRSVDVAKANDVTIRGCLLENVARNQTAPMLYLRSFELEKLLSSSNAQIMKYTSADGITVQAHRRELSEQEISCVAFREDLQKGVIQFAEDAAHIRKTLLKSYAPPVEISKALVNEFFSRHSSDESELLAQVVLDDHYCGRGVV
ncbi:MULTISPECIES: rhamnan synthesis F family protein [unclassified Pseudomonas]|uniref:rhamnan synthesis F family protein n=1 Tax=unclassified Pseudomonas TaxID=196821 RepID=UPI000C2FBAE7|nr:MULTISPECIES: rhamnan synthesis F family protein [unclassified Pseudomonas]MCU1736109.1 methyltransferase domain-containing protein [Pseudomonas sp. 20S_6.2_Bac1]